jgi:MFS family permease
MIYVGLEVTIGGWIVSYIVEVREGACSPFLPLLVSATLTSARPVPIGGPSAGYTSSGFFAGLTVGRIIFIPLTKRLGENLSIYVYTTAALGLEMIVWFVPSLIGNAVAVSFVGVFIGPHYPIVISAVTKLIPRSHAGGAIGWIGTSSPLSARRYPASSDYAHIDPPLACRVALSASFGQAGSAVFPFIVGAIAQQHGLEVRPLPFRRSGRPCRPLSSITY